MLVPVTVAASFHDDCPGEGEVIEVLIVDVALPVTLKFLDFTHVVAPGAPSPDEGFGVDGTRQTANWYSPPGFVVVLNSAAWNRLPFVRSNAWCVVVEPTGFHTLLCCVVTSVNSRCVQVPPV